MIGKKCKVATWALNNRIMHGKTQEEMADIALEKLSLLAEDKPDLVCFPEIFLKTGGDLNNPDWVKIAQRSVEMMQKKAAEMKCYVATSIYEPSQKHSDLRYNCSVLIGRDGNIAGKYRKNHTVVMESEKLKVIPSGDLPVFDTDFGRIGMLVCFDIGWRDTWKAIAEKGARMIIWASAYDGGSLLNTYAAHNVYYVVSSVRTDHAKIIDLTGRTIKQSSVWDGLAMATVDLNTELFHIDQQYNRIEKLRKALGSKVTINTYSEENYFTIEPNDPEWPMERIKKEFDFINYKDYHAIATKVQEEWREKYFETDVLD